MPSGSRRSPAAKRYLANLRLKISPLVATIFRSFSGNETSNWRDSVTNWYCGNILDFHARLPENLSVQIMYSKIAGQPLIDKHGGQWRRNDMWGHIFGAKHREFFYPSTL